MIILFGNQKGGCGKTTNCIQFANYLVEKEKRTATKLINIIRYDNIIWESERRLW